MGCKVVGSQVVNYFLSRSGGALFFIPNFIIYIILYIIYIITILLVTIVPIRAGGVNLDEKYLTT